MNASKSLQKTGQKKPLNSKKDENKAPLYSIIIPTYNEAKTIKRLVLILRKFYPEAEIVVVDDNSPDGTAKIVSKIAKKDQMIRLVKRREKLGLSSAIIEGIKSSSTPFFVICDAPLDIFVDHGYASVIITLNSNVCVVCSFFYKL